MALRVRQSIRVFCRRVFAYPLAIRGNHADFTVVEIYLVVLVYQADRVSLVCVDVTEDQSR